MITATLQKAIDSLQIQDVYLRSSHSECVEGFCPQYEDFSSLHLQQMHIIKRAAVFETESADQLLQIQILMGTRWVVSTSIADQPDIKAFIEAEFVAEYRFKSNNIDQETIDEFAQKNASYHVWPYWREYLASQTERLRLPRVVLPTMQLGHHKPSLKELS